MRYAIVRSFTIVILALFMTLLSCEIPLKATLMEVVKDYSRPMTSVSPDLDGSLDKYSPVIITFTETMNPRSLTLSGFMAAESDGGIWSDSETGLNSVLTISPRSSWTAGSGRTLSVQCLDQDGYDIETLVLIFGVLDGVVYVHATGGNNNNPGTKLEPKKSIQPAIDVAGEFYSEAEVHVAEGLYQVNYSQGNYIIMKKGISLLGGYKSDDWQVRNYVLYETIISDSGSIIAPDPGNVPDQFRSRAVDSGTGLTSATIIEGFTIIGGGGSVSIGLNCTGSNPTIQNNIVNGGLGDLSAALRIKDCSPLIYNNDINGGIGGDESLGIFTANSTSIIEGNRINGGEASSCNGIFNYASNPIIRNNSLILGGDARASNTDGITIGLSNAILNMEGSNPIISGNNINGGYGWVSVSGINNSSNSSPSIRNNLIFAGIGPAAQNSLSFGIMSEDSNGQIQNNIINGGRAESSVSCGIQLTNSHPVIANNILFNSGGDEQYGVYMFGAGGYPASFDNNDIYNCDTSRLIEEISETIKNDYNDL